MNTLQDLKTILKKQKILCEFWFKTNKKISFVKNCASQKSITLKSIARRNQSKNEFCKKLRVVAKIKHTKIKRAEINQYAFTKLFAFVCESVGHSRRARRPRLHARDRR